MTVYKEHVFPYAVLDMSPRFTGRTRLQVTPHQAQLLDARFEAARRVYNVLLGEMKRRLDLLRQSRTWHAARKTRHDKTKRARLFAQARAHYGFSRP
ncbi:MAG TPA: helix-turn-helix domain-containing protein, partial [Bacillota bacterium]|nr:helix-turn-helix domain-containing protein [Bacillota bacterium]